MGFNSSFVYDSLHCSEEEYLVVEEDEESCFNNGINNESDPDDELSYLLSKEEQNQLYYERLQNNEKLAVGRFDAVEWLLKVNSHYSFSALTAVLSVNYFDRFLFSFCFQSEKPWMIQLAAVACLSLAAKVEETQVPSLLDLQVEESKYVFEAKTIQRMEILVLSTLQWKMKPVTPISFLDYIARKLRFKDHFCCEFLKRCDQILLSVISDSRFLRYLPSVVATAIMLQVMDCVESKLRVEFQNQLLGNLGIHKDKVDESCKLILESARTRIEGNRSNKRRLSSIPGNPNDIMDLLFISDRSNSSCVVLSSVSSSPVSKKIKTHQEQFLERLSHAPSDFLSIPH